MAYNDIALAYRVARLSMDCLCARLPPAMQPSRTSESVFGSVVRSTKEPRTAARGGYLFRGLELRTSTDGRRTFILCPELAGEDLYRFPLLCWEGAQVGAFNLELNNELDDGTVIYHAAPRSYLLLEPFRPVTVTEAVESMRCIKSVDVGLRVGLDEPFWMAKGKLIHTLFDHLLQAEGEGDAGHGAFDEAFRHGLVRFREILPGSAISTTEPDLEREARAHFSHLEAWLRSVRGRFHSLEVEADRVSTRWGLRGRADAVLRTEQGSLVVELKSGKPVPEDHLKQLFAYCLLFTEEEGGHCPDGCVVYSATGKQEDRPASCPEAKRALVAGRNRVVALKRAHTRSACGLSDWCDGDGVCDNKPCFARRHCYRLFGSGSGKPPTLRGKEREYYEGWFRALSLDLWSVEGDLARVLDPGTLAERVAEGVTLRVHEVELESVGGSLSAHEDTREPPEGYREELQALRSGSRPRRKTLIRLDLSTDGHSADFGAGEEVFLHRGDPGCGHSFRGRVARSDESGLYVDIQAPLRNESDHLRRDFGALSEPGWYLDRIPFSRGRDVARKALLQFLWSADRQIVRVVAHGDSREVEEQDPSAPMARTQESAKTLEPGSRDAGRHQNAVAAGLRARQAHVREGELASETGLPSLAQEDAPADLCFSEGLAAELNEEQEAAIRSALDCSTYHLIHGPPGTGKTRALARLIALCLDRGERVLVACPTNVALDALLIAVMDLGVKDFIRVARRSHVSARFWEAVRRAGSSQVLLGDLCALDLNFRAFRNLARSKKLVGATAYQCAAHSFFLRQRFDRVIVDEAGQLDEPSTLAPLALAKKFVLGGDHLQLPPVVQSRQGHSVARDDYSLEQSLFERLFLTSPESTISRLRMQYRMNQEVQDIPSRLFYEGSLFPSPEARRRRLSISPGVSGDELVNRIIDPESPVVFVDVQGPDSGKARPEEAEAACRIVESLVASGVPSHEIGVITPYRAQQALIRNRLLRSGNGFPLLTVDTVDRFQGGEREVIILSLCRSDEVTSFLADRKRLNVSLSRARSKLILLGHGPVLEGHPLFASILQGLERITMSPEG